MRKKLTALHLGAMLFGVPPHNVQELLNPPAQTRGAEARRLCGPTPRFGSPSNGLFYIIMHPLAARRSAAQPDLAMELGKVVLANRLKLKATEVLEQ